MTRDQRERYDLLAHIIAGVATHEGTQNRAWVREYLELHRLYQAWLDEDAA